MPLIQHQQPHPPTTEDDLINELRRHRDEATRLQRLADQRLASNVHVEAELRRERDARATLQLELDAAWAATGIAGAVRGGRLDVRLSEIVAKFKAERDEVRNDLVVAMQTIEAATIDQPVGFAVWLISRGWLVGVTRAEVHHDISAITFVDRLADAARFATEGEATAALELVAAGEPVTHLSEVGAVVTL